MLVDAARPTTVLMPRHRLNAPYPPYDHMVSVARGARRHDHQRDAVVQRTEALMKPIALAWVITLPAVAILASLSFIALRAAF
jgi:hypothetical protein